MSYVSPFTGDVIQPTDVSFRAVTLSANTQLNWPSNSTTNTDFAARMVAKACFKAITSTPVALATSKAAMMRPKRCKLSA